MGCEVNILRLVEYLRAKQQSKEGRESAIYFMDLKSAFDTVDHGILFRKMEELGIDDRITNTVK